MRDFGIPILGSTVARTFKRLLRAILVSEDGAVAIAGARGDDVLQTVRSPNFFPEDGEGQTVAFAAVAVHSAVLTPDVAHWIFCEDDSCWIRLSDNTPATLATAGDFPLPVGAIAEFTPNAAGQYISVIQRGGAGNLMIGVSERLGW